MTKARGTLLKFDSLGLAQPVWHHTWIMAVDKCIEHYDPWCKVVVKLVTAWWLWRGFDSQRKFISKQEWMFDRLLYPKWHIHKKLLLSHYLLFLRSSQCSEVVWNSLTLRTSHLGCWGGSVCKGTDKLLLILWAHINGEKHKLSTSFHVCATAQRFS